MPTEPHGPRDDVNPAFRLGDWLVEPDLNRISRDGESSQLEPKIMNLLVFLAQHAGRVVSKNDIIDGVWSAQYVANSALSRSMALLRRSLGDDARKPTYIETISKRGFRVIPEVEWIGRPAPPGEDGTPPVRIVLGEREIALHPGENIIGRAREATVRIDSPRVSRRHARLMVDGLNATIEDLESKNGTYLQGRLLSAPAKLEDGDEISVGATVMTFRVADDDRPTETASARRRSTR
jgi:DNA-binding winged helix-turn-helix (wHTH) protein